jgi:hypothetical protein
MEAKGVGMSLKRLSWLRVAQRIIVPPRYPNPVFCGEWHPGLDHPVYHRRGPLCDRRPGVGWHSGAEN